ncbi:cytidine deaminase [Clostridium sp. Marseille-P3244]|uniref:cytidine deaminase n=1 Tax=Clostridium sp. Marseille-P3244 TaxID=1871020 RepID=UPI0009313A56|nr:cytidine deaminase [Clostridium sp. Marseille-P3244]
MNITEINAAGLIQAALLARENSYSPYSHFRVGAALLCTDGKIYSGCNIENRAYGPTNCAERTAFFKAVSEGEREFLAIAIVGGEDAPVWCYPCGVCRQVMAEFCQADSFRVICARSVSEYKEYTLGELLPEMF